jgi:hypothetical protein
MWSAAKAILAGGVGLALWAAPSVAAAQIQVTSAGAEYESFHPRPVVQAPASGEGFQATMDRTFGPGRWRQTSGFRTQAQENALRRQGAGTVAPGRISYHSLGAPDAPHAYDAVVAGMSPARAAVKLKQVGGPFTRVLAEGAHGPQGAHLHIELASTAMRRAAPAEAAGDYPAAPPPGRKRSWRPGQASAGSTSE